MVFVFALGFCYGKCFKKFNPFLIFFGSFIFLPIFAAVINSNNSLITGAFVVGFFWNFKEKLQSGFNPFESLQMKFQSIRADRQYKQRQKEAEERYKQEQKKEADRQKYQQKQKNGTEQRYKKKYTKQRRPGEGKAWQEEKKRKEETLRRREEELKRREEELKQQQRRQDEEFRKNQQKQKDLKNQMPKTFDEARKVLEVSINATYEKINKKRISLIKQFHTDINSQNISEPLKKYANEMSKKINVAWEIVDNYFKKKG
jgi:flagellar biosynthesis GTPase FlhF